MQSDQSGSTSVKNTRSRSRSSSETRRTRSTTTKDTLSGSDQILEDFFPPQPRNTLAKSSVVAPEPTTSSQLSESSLVKELIRDTNSLTDMQLTLANTMTAEQLRALHFKQMSLAGFDPVRELVISLQSIPDPSKKAAALMAYLKSLGQTPQQATELAENRLTTATKGQSATLTVNIVKFGDLSTAALKKIESENATHTFQKEDYAEFYRTPEGQDLTEARQNEHLDSLKKVSPVLQPRFDHEKPSDQPTDHGS